MAACGTGARPYLCARCLATDRARAASAPRTPPGLGGLQGCAGVRMSCSRAPARHARAGARPPAEL